MAVIGTLRDKMGTWVVVFVFVAIAAFVLGDLFSGNSNILSWGRNSVGEIGGKEISYEEFLAVIQEREATYFLQTGRQPSDREMPGIRQQAWDLLIARYAIQPQFAEVGVQVSDEEVVDMINGKNIDPTIRQSFTNPQTGEFDLNQLNQYISQLNQMPEGSEPRVRWEIFQKDLKPGRERIKYENLLVKTNYVTKAEAEREYHLQTDVAEVKYLYVPFYAISDTLAQVSDADLQAYYNKNKEKYKTEASRDIKYVSLPIVPSGADSAAVLDGLLRARNEFRTANQDSVYATNNTEGSQPYQKYSRATLPEFLNADSLIVGTVFGPVLDGDMYKVAKVSKVYTDTVYSARAKHILIKWDDTSDAAKSAAKEKARGILKDIKAGADFAVKAREFGTDGTASRGGDLGWFSSGQMVKPFETAVFNATKTGVLNDVVETDFGYHIISVTNTKTNKAYEIAMVELAITPSDATINDAFRKAEEFAADLDGIQDFELKAKESGLNVLEAKNVAAGDRRIGMIGEARQLVQWLFRDASVGEVSQVFDLGDQNVVAVMTGQIEKGYKPLELVKEEIKPAVRNEVKGKMIAEKLSGLKGTLEEMATSYGSDANVYTSSDLKLVSSSLPTVGFDPKAVGTAFSLENGKRSGAIIGENGVTIIELQNKTIAPALTDYTLYVNQLEQANRGRSGFNIAEAIKENSGIDDQRYKFF